MIYENSKKKNPVEDPKLKKITITVILLYLSLIFCVPAIDNEVPKIFSAMYI